MQRRPLGWFGIVRLGLVQTALGAVVVLSTSTVNRLMVVELALPALVPGVLVAWHYALQILRPRFGHGSDVGGRRTPWIIGGMTVLALGGFGAALSVPLIATDRFWGMVLAALSFSLIGAGVGAAGTTLLVLLAGSVERERRAAAATIVWIMMIAGFVITAAVISKTLAPYSPERLVEVAAIVCTGAVVLAIIAVAGLESRLALPVRETTDQAPFREALAEVWRDDSARRFAIFVFVSMLAYSAQELVLEPFAALVFGLLPGESALIAGAQHGGALFGMIAVGTLATFWSRSRLSALRGWIVAGCVGSAIAVIALAVASRIGPSFPLRPAVFALGFANGVYAVAAISAMFTLAASAGRADEGIRMGLFGAAQGVAFGIGGLGGSSLSDLARWVLGTPDTAYGLVFGVEAALFLASAVLAISIGREARARVEHEGHMVPAQSRIG